LQYLKQKGIHQLTTKPPVGTLVTTPRAEGKNKFQFSFYAAVKKIATSPLICKFMVFFIQREKATFVSSDEIFPEDFSPSLSYFLVLFIVHPSLLMSGTIQQEFCQLTKVGSME
jgi:hypothetical protein